MQRYSGAIDLRDTAVGNVLVIGDGATAGTDGGGVFVSNGGALHLNMVVNDQRLKAGGFRLRLKAGFRPPFSGLSNLQ